MDNFAAPKKHGRFDFIALFQKADDVIFLEFIIVLIRIGSKLHFLNRNIFLVFLRLMKLLVHLVEVLSVIHDSANGRRRRRRYLYQVQAPFFSDFKRRLRRHNSELLVLVVNDAHFASPDSLVDPNVFVDGLDLLNRHMRQTFTLANYLTCFQLARTFSWL